MSKVIKEEISGEITEKKSRFIATVRPVKTEEEALSFIQEMKKKYYDARHNCSAYLIGDPAEGHSSDDGEPSGTAGRPMMDVLTGEGLTDVAVVVTRYFGGVLLGTGGLVKAYQGALKEALSHARYGQSTTGYKVSFSINYEILGKAEYLLKDKEIPILSSDYGQDITFTVFLTEENKENIKNSLIQLSAGKAVFLSEEIFVYEI